jgi:hypothetical protein
VFGFRPEKADARSFSWKVQDSRLLNAAKVLIEAGGAKELVSYVLYTPQIFTAEVNCPW